MVGSYWRHFTGEGACARQKPQPTGRSKRSWSAMRQTFNPWMNIHAELYMNLLVQNLHRRKVKGSKRTLPLLPWLLTPFFCPIRLPWWASYAIKVYSEGTIQEVKSTLMMVIIMIMVVVTITAERRRVAISRNGGNENKVLSSKLSCEISPRQLLIQSALMNIQA